MSHYASPYWFASNGDTKKLERFQRRLTEWAPHSVVENRDRLIMLEILAIPLYLKMLDILTLLKISNGAHDFDHSNLFTLRDSLKRGNRKLDVTRTSNFGSFSNEIFYKSTCDLSFLPSIYTTKPVGLKAKVLRSIMHNFT